MDHLKELGLDTPETRAQLLTVVEEVVAPARELIGRLKEGGSAVGEVLENAANFKTELVSLKVGQKKMRYYQKKCFDIHFVF